METVVATKRCRDCGKPKKGKFRRCRACLDTRGAYRARIKAEALAEGYCGVCYKRPTEPEDCRCAPCRERDLRLHVEARARAVAAGKCVACYRREPKEGMRRCHRCWTRKRSYERARRRALEMERREAKREAKSTPALIKKALVENHRLTLEQLAGEIGVSTRTALRNLHGLVASGEVTYVSGDPEDGHHQSAKVYLLAVNHG